MLLLLTIVAVLRISVASGLRTCGDCMKIEECLQAKEFLANSESQTTEVTLTSNLCGVDSQGKAKVCCSGFSRLETVDPIENHPNVHLLPEECGEMEGNSVYPWIVHIQYNPDVYKCVGSLINSRYVLTTGYCMSKGNIAAVRVCTDVDCDDNYQVIAVTDKLAHENFRWIGRGVNDIGLLRLKKPVNSCYGNASPVCLPISAALRKVNLYSTKAIAYGWKETYAGNYNKFLQTVTIHTLEACNVVSKRIVGHNEMELRKQFCTEYIAPDSCWRFANGALMVEDSCDGINQYIQYGILSYASPECLPDRPTFYTDVRVYMKWILDNIKE